MVKICFIDKDGVINKLVCRSGTLTAPWNLNEVKYYPDVAESIDRIKQLGFVTCIVTNQPDFGVLKYNIEHLDKILLDIQTKFKIDYIVCNHQRNTNYYKPNSLSLQTLINSLDSNVNHCYFIGDTWKDVVAAYGAGIDSIYIKRNNQKYTSDSKYSGINPTYIASSLADASLLISEIELLKEAV